MSNKGSLPGFDPHKETKAKNACEMTMGSNTDFDLARLAEKFYKDPGHVLLLLLLLRIDSAIIRCDGAAAQ